jgi:glutamine amidotransferase
LIAVVDYGIGNLRSAQKALERVGAEAALTDDPDVISGADGVVLPGVGAFGRCMEALRHAGLEDVTRTVIQAGTPFLGICIGMQMLFDGSEEDPATPGLGVVDGQVTLLPDGVKRPQMQWNTLERRRASGMLDGLAERPWVYFVHSYAPAADEYAVATCDYGGSLVAAIERDNVWATQFHPEKSGAAGLCLLANFVSATHR